MTDYQSIALQILKAAETASKTANNPEAKLRELVSPLWKDYLKIQQLDLNLEPRDELILAYGRADTIYNRLILEYKRPGSIKKDNGRNRQIIAQIQGYIEDYAKKERWEEPSLFGVAFDGLHFLFIHKIRRWIIEDPVEINAGSLERFFLVLSKLVGKTALLPNFLIRDFAVGIGSTGIAAQAIKAFYFALTTNVHPKVKVFFIQWANQFAEVHGSIEEKKFDDKVLFDQYGFNDDEQENFNHLAFFYALDTYYALLMKLLAYQVVGYYAKIGFGKVPLADWEELDSRNLQDKISQIEQGGIFREQLHIRNFLEGDLLSWYLNDWNPSIEHAIQEIIKRLNGYDPQTMELLPDETRDILKKLYQFLVPKKIRHDLGEYYTPDWLAERCLNQVGYGVNEKTLLQKRVLDPGCGSGTFLILAIKRAKEHARLHGISPAKALEEITKNIVGFDLNPLAVISARTNYLLAVAELLKEQKGFLTIPVYLCDSINPPSPKHGEDLFDQEHNQYKVPTTVGVFKLPEFLIKEKLIPAVTELLEDAVTKKLNRQQLVQRVVSDFAISDKDVQELERTVGESFSMLVELDKKGINGIWARIIKNAFAPIFEDQFDIVVGNPPWVNWESLPEEYKKATSTIWERYDLFEHTGLQARLGSAKDDISVLMTYVAIDKYLKTKGKLCFVITQSLFKTVGGGEGFRRFRLGRKGIPFKVLQVDDMVELQPFDSATNRTSVFFCQKGEETKYPIEYVLWRKKEKGGIAIDLTWKEVQDKTYVKVLKAQSIDGTLQGAWITAKPKALKALGVAVGMSDYKARSGSCTWLNSIYWGDYVSKDGEILFTNLHKVGKIKVECITANINKELVFPLLRGREVRRWSSLSKSCIIVPQDSVQPSKAISLERMKTNYENTLNYFSKFKVALSGRSGYKKYLKEQEEPFYALYNIGPYTFSPFKVVWKEQSSGFECAVIGSLNEKVIVPDHKLMLVPFNEEIEAHYVCAILNSTVTRFIVQAYTISTQQSTHILENIKIKRFNPKNSTHQDLSRLSKLCHEKVALGIDVCDLEDQIDQLAAELWGLTNEELQEIKESLEEM